MEVQCCESWEYRRKRKMITSSILDAVNLAKSVMTNVTDSFIDSKRFVNLNSSFLFLRDDNVIATLVRKNILLYFSLRIFSFICDLITKLYNKRHLMMNFVESELVYLFAS